MLSRDITVSVTQLADFACREGDLMPAGVAGPSAREGMRAHKKLQDQRKTEAGHAQWLSSELRVSCLCKAGELNVKIGGRIDLVDTRHHVLTEFKTTLVPPDKLPESQLAVQWAQLYIYGYVYLQSVAHLPDIPQSLDLELVHINIRDATEGSQTRTVKPAQLLKHAEDAIQCYASWIEVVQLWTRRMMATATTLKFPFETFRQGQRDMAAAIYRASRDGESLMCEAPTGIGKTVSSLYPAIKSMGEGKIKQLVYLTAKVGGRRSADEAMRGLRTAGLDVTTIQVRAKETTCFCSNGRCERDSVGRCPMTLGFFDRLPQARDELMRLGAIDNEVLDEVAWSHQVCPFELVLQMLPWVQVVITDYNYVFDPLVRLGHYAADRNDTLLLVDEAHNLVDRSRSMYSAELDRELCMQAATECRDSHALVAKSIDSLVRRLASLSGSMEEDEFVLNDAPAELSRSVSAALGQINVAMALPSVLGEITRELWRNLCRYTVIDELYTEQHRCMVSGWDKGRRRQVVVRLYCLDASRALAASYRHFRAAVLFSATLRPGTFYRDSLGLKADIGYLGLSSPFDSANCLRAVVDWIDTRYRHRHTSLDALVMLINQSTMGRLGNYLVFFPSYSYLEQVHAQFTLAHPERQTWVQTRGQSRQQQQELIDALDDVGHRVGFAIQGGVFGEGIDYRGDRLIGTLIIGTGLPAFDQQTELIAGHYRQTGRDGYDFAYRYPGFTRVLQTAGRVIRSENDTGFVLLVDSRFRQTAYQTLFPVDWSVIYPADLKELTVAISEFWEKIVPQKTKENPANSAAWKTS